MEGLDRSLESLDGVTGFELIVEELSPEIEQGGLTKSQIEGDIKAQFRKAGIRLLSREETNIEPGMPWFYVRIIVVKHQMKRDYAYSVEVSWRQNVVLARDKEVTVIGAPTWRTRETGISSNLKEDISSATKEHVDAFIKAYLSVNAKWLELLTG